MVAMSCSGDCGFLAANLYAKSVFGEDALVNLSVEKGADGKLSGYIRIRYAPPRHLSLSACDRNSREQHVLHSTSCFHNRRSPIDYPERKPGTCASEWVCEILGYSSVSP